MKVKIIMVNGKEYEKEFKDHDQLLGVVECLERPKIEIIPGKKFIMTRSIESVESLEEPVKAKKTDDEK